MACLEDPRAETICINVGKGTQPAEESTLFIHRAIYSKFVNIFVGVFEKVRVSIIYTNCPSERYNQIVRRTVAGFFLGLTTSPILNDPEASVPFDCFKLLFLTPALEQKTID
jgi:hypothetical protein